MAEQSNRTNPGPQEQEQAQDQEQTQDQEQHQAKAKEPWWMDHVRQLVVGSPATQADAWQTPPPPPPPPRRRSPSGPPAWALANMSPPAQAAPKPQPRPAVQEQDTQAHAEPQQPPPEQPSEQPPVAQEQETAEQAAGEQTAEALEAQEPQREPELRGFTNKLSIASILDFLSINRQSGTLYLTNTRETFTLEILEGDIVHASSNLSNDEQLLGSILVARDKIGTEQLEDFYRRFSPNADTQSTSDYEDLVSREDLKLAVEAQVQELFNRLYAADDCSFCFYEGETSGVEQRIRMNVTRLLLESARNQDELEQDPTEAVGTEAVEVDKSCSEMDLDEVREFDDAVSFDATLDGVVEQDTVEAFEDTPPLEDTALFDSGECQEWDRTVDELADADEVDPADLRNI